MENMDTDVKGLSVKSAQTWGRSNWERIPGSCSALFHSCIFSMPIQWTSMQESCKQQTCWNFKKQDNIFLGINKEFCFLSFKQKEGLLFKFIEFYDFKIICVVQSFHFSICMAFFPHHKYTCPHRFRVFNLPNLSLMLYFNT